MRHSAVLRAYDCSGLHRNDGLGDGRKRGSLHMPVDERYFISGIHKILTLRTSWTWARGMRAKHASLVVRAAYV